MTFKPLLVMVLTSLTMVGCISAEERNAAFEKRQQRSLDIKNQEAPLRAEIAKTTPQCQAKEDCDSKMQAAYSWVVKNSDYKVRVANDTMVETYGPSHADGDVAITVSKEPISSGKFAIVASMACKNPSMVAEYNPRTSCKVDLLKKTIEFNNFVNNY